MTDNAAGDSGARDRFPYPGGNVVGVLLDDAALTSARERLAKAGFTPDRYDVLEGERDIARIDVEGDEHGLVGTIKRWLQGVLSDDADHARRYAEHLREGHFVLGVSMGEDEAAKQRERRTMRRMTRACDVTGGPSLEPKVTIRPACTDDEADLARRLWGPYMQFSRVELPTAVTDATWKRIITPDSPMRALVAADAKGRLIAFAIFVVHDYSFDDRPACLIDDAYVHPEARRPRNRRAS